MRNAIVFFSLSNLVLLIVTGVLMAWLLHRGLAPMRQLAAEAENISIHRWSFQAPESAVETRELAPLASALTAAMQRLEASFSQQRRFVGDAAHELKTAVAVVKSSLQLLNMRQRTTDEYEAGVEVSLADCERMEEIVARMLTLARAEHPTTAEHAAGTVDLAVAVAASAQQFQSMAELRSVTIALVTSGPAFVGLPIEECSLLCSNLLLNALQHSPSILKSKCCCMPEGEMVELRIEDSGDGIEPALLPHVFERFSRGDPSRSRNTGGTGLGLAICKAIVDKAGGTIALHSEVGQGTTAVVRLPRVYNPQQRLRSNALCRQRLQLELILSPIDLARRGLRQTERSCPIREVEVLADRCYWSPRWFAVLPRSIAQGPYHLITQWKIGGDGGWDYLVADAAAHRLYITHGPRVEVIDTGSGKSSRRHHRAARHARCCAGCSREVRLHQRRRAPMRSWSSIAGHSRR